MLLKQQAYDNKSCCCTLAVTARRDASPHQAARSVIAPYRASPYQAARSMIAPYRASPYRTMMVRPRLRRQVYVRRTLAESVAV